MKRDPSRSVARHLVLALVAAGVGWHLWLGSQVGLVVAAAVVVAHGAAALLGYRSLRRRAR